MRHVEHQNIQEIIATFEYELNLAYSKAETNMRQEELNECIELYNKGKEEELRELASKKAGYPRVPRIGDFLDTAPKPLDHRSTPLLTRMYTM